MAGPRRSDSAGSPVDRLFGGIGDAFADANFRRYSVGSIVSWLSFFIQAVAVSWTAWSLTHSTGWLSAVALLDSVPMALLAPLGGIVADRYDRFRVLMVCYVFAAVQSAILTILAATGHLGIAALAALAFAHGLIHAFSVPAFFGLLPRFVARERLASAIGVSSAYSTLGLFVGPALGGWVLLHFGPAVAFASNVAGYLVYFASAALLETPADYVPPRRPQGAIVADFVESVRAVLDHAGIRGLFALMLFGDALTQSVRQMLPAFADRDMHAGVAGLSTLLASLGVGATLSALWIAHGGVRRISAEAISSGFLGYLVATAGAMLSPSLFWAAGAMVARGFCYELCRTGLVALLQTSVPDHLRGRLMSTQFFLQQGAGALGLVLVGAGAERWGVRMPVLCGVALALAVWIVIQRKRGAMASAFAAAPVPEP